MLCAKAINLHRRGNAVLNGVDITAAEGEIVAICGPNGAGKSSLLSVLAGLEPQAEGEVLLGGRPAKDLSLRERARLCGYLPQQAEAAWDVSVETLVSLGRLPWRSVPGRPARAARADDREAVAKAIAAMQLEALARRPLSQLSGGERARAMLARVLAGRPRLVLADEPFASLDIAHARHLALLLRKEAARGCAMVVVMHDLAMAMNLADRILVLDKGNVAAAGSPQTALAGDVLSRVWGIEARWLGDHGARALAMGPFGNP